MKRLGTSLVWISTIIGTVLAISCSKGPTPQATPQAAAPVQPQAAPAAQPAPQATAAPAQPAPPAIPPAGIASGQFSQDPDLRCDLMEVKRASGGALLIKWRLVNAAASQAKSIKYHGEWGVTPPWNDLYFIDPAENKKYAFLTDAGGGYIADVFWGDLPAGQQRASWAKFPAPPLTSSKISVHIPSFPPFEDVPISQ